MSNIEEDIMSEEAFNELIDNFEIVRTLTEYGRKAIKQNVKNLQKRIKELEEDNATLRKANNIAKELTKGIKIEDITQVINKSYEEFMRQFIPVQKVKDILKELNQEYIKIDKSIDIHKKSDDRGKVDCLQMISWLEGKLEELLEDK